MLWGPAQRSAAPVSRKPPLELARLRARVDEHAETVLEEKFAKSTIPDLSYKLPQFSLEEVIKGKYLGKGFFGMVYEIQGLDGRDIKGKIVQPKDSHQPKRSSTATWLCGKQNVQSGYDESEDDDAFFAGESDLEEEDEDYPDLAIKAVQRKQEAARSFMRRHCQRDNGQSRYAIKILRPEVLLDPTKLYFQGVMDMQSETRLLSSIQHPHIIKLRAIAKGASKCNENCFLILDRLYEVLEDRLKVWERRYKRNASIAGKIMLDRQGRKRAQLWENRMVAAHDLASALGYLHSRRIIHRDLKSDNIGFDIRGDLKIFDFGLARELPPESLASAAGIWKMTGSTGTPRYMSPEVALDKSYNESCDSYSFCMLLWEMLALKTPFELYSMKSFVTRVWQSPHKRPPLDEAWPRSLQLLLQRGWHPVLTQRPPMKSVVETLRKEVIQCREDADQRWGLDVLAERRSTHVFDDDDVDKSHNSILSSIFSSPFHGNKKSPFRLGGKPTLSSRSLGDGSSHHSKATPKPTKEVPLDSTKATAIIDYSLSPTYLDFSGSNCSASPGLASLPKLPLLDDDEDDSDEFFEEPVNKEGDCNQQSSEGHQSPNVVVDTTLYRSPGSAELWERIEAEKVRHKKIRQRLSTTKAAAY